MPEQRSGNSSNAVTGKFPTMTKLRFHSEEKKNALEPFCKFVTFLKCNVKTGDLIVALQGSCAVFVQKELFLVTDVKKTSYTFHDSFMKFPNLKKQKQMLTSAPT